MFVVLAFKSEATLSVGERESTWGQVPGEWLKVRTGIFGQGRVFSRHPRVCLCRVLHWHSNSNFFWFLAVGTKNGKYWTQLFLQKPHGFWSQGSYSGHRTSHQIRTWSRIWAWFEKTRFCLAADLLAQSISPDRLAFFTESKEILLYGFHSNWLTLESWKHWYPSNVTKASEIGQLYVCYSIYICICENTFTHWQNYLSLANVSDLQIKVIHPSQFFSPLIIALRS